jgi:hypothetical protein
MKSIITVLAILMSIGSAVAVRAGVTSISNKQKTTIVGDRVTVVDSKTTVIKDVKPFSKSRASTRGLKTRTR